MTCEQTELDILAYLTDEVDAGEAAKVRDHLESCPACAAEAAELRSISQHLSTRLKEIPPAMAVPPLVSARIERALRAERRQTGRRSWWPGLTVAIAAAAVVLVSFAVRPDLAEQVAEVPVVGLVASAFLQPDYEVQLGALPPSPAASIGATQRREPNVGATANGVTVKVTRIEYRANQTLLWYRAEGVKLTEAVDLAAYQPVVSVNGRPVKLYRLTADQRGEDVLFLVSFEATTPGPKITLQLNGLPVEGQQPGQTQPWVIQVE